MTRLSRLAPLLLAPLFGVLALNCTYAADPALEAYLRGLRAPPTRDEDALVAWRRQDPLLVRSLAAVAREARPLQVRRGAVWVIGALGDTHGLVPTDAQLPAELAPIASHARGLVGIRISVQRSLTQSASVEALVDLLRRPQQAELLELVGDPLWNAPLKQRLRAVAVAAKLPGDLATNVVWSRLDDPAPQVRLAAARGLAARGAVRALELRLGDLAQKGDPAPLEVALRCLHGAGADPLVSCSVLLRSSGLSAIGQAALASALGRCGWKRARSLLRRVTADEDRPSMARTAAWSALVKLGLRADDQAQATRALLRAAILGAPIEQASALEGLVLLPRSEVRDRILEALRWADTQGHARAGIARLSEALELHSLGPSLARIAENADTFPRARQAALHALGRLEPRPGVDAALLTVAARASDPPSLRREALASLARRARERASVPARLALERALADPETSVRREALRGLIALADPLSANGLVAARPQVRRVGEARLWVEAALRLRVRDSRGSLWVLGLCQANATLRADAPLAVRSIDFASQLPARVAVPILLELLGHARREVQAAAKAELRRRLPVGKSWDAAGWRKAWSERSGEFR